MLRKTIYIAASFSLPFIPYSTAVAGSSSGSTPGSSESVQCSIVDTGTGIAPEEISPLVPHETINVDELSSPSVIVKADIPRFKVYRGKRLVSRVARPIPGEFKNYSTKTNLVPGQYIVGLSATPSRYRTWRNRWIQFNVTDSEGHTGPTPTPTRTPRPGTGSARTPTPTPRPNTPKSTSTLSSFAGWQQQMLAVGKKYCDRAGIQSLGTWEGSVWYYDGIKVYQQIAEYTGDSSWYTCAQYVREIYRGYVLSNNGRVGGWRVFPQGLLKDWQRTGDAQSRTAVVQLATNSPFAAQAGGADPELSRETAYLIHAYRAGAAAGSPQPALLAKAVDNALGHLSAWRNGNTGYVKPFMMALSMEALIDYAEESGDSRVLPAVQASADWLWGNLWNANSATFPYIFCRTPSASTECSSVNNSESADLDLLIVPVYGWLYHKTGVALYRDRGDALFSAGVAKAWLGSGKQFSQNYRWSFDYLKWRNG